MKLVVIESPYAGDVEKNLEYARRCMAHSLRLGEYPIASHLLYTQPGILDDDIPAERELGIGAGLAWAKFADKAIFYVDNGVSNGMMAAHDLYICEGKRIEYRSLHCDILNAVNNLETFMK